MKNKIQQLDESVPLMCNAMQNLPIGKALVIIDETADYAQYIPLARRPGTTLLCTHLDTYTLLSEFSADIHFCDPKLKELDAESFDFILFRTSKAKAFSHFVINQSLRLLKPAKMLFLAGQRSEGIKTYQKKAATLLGDATPETKLSNGFRIAKIRKFISPSDTTATLPDEDYASLRQLTLNGLTFNTKPGIYGWDKIDVGSRMLKDLLPNLNNQRVLDLGCGYGYLSIATHKKGAAEIIATDNDARAISACIENFSLHDIKGEVIASDCGKDLEGPVDFIVCNPPFHQGFETSTKLSDRFMQAMSRLLAPGGTCMIVCNAFLPYEKRATGLFDHCDKLVEENGFKVLQFSRNQT